MPAHAPATPLAAASEARGRRSRRAWWAAAVLLGGCAGFSAERGQRLEQRVERLETEGVARPVQPDENKASQDQTRRLDARLAEMQAKVGELGAASQQARAERSARDAKLEKLAEEVSRLRAALDGYARRLDSVERSAVPARPGRGRAPERKAAVSSEQPRPAPEPRGAAPGKTGFLALAREQESKGQKAVARDMYQEYVTKFPTGPDAAQAHYRLGELAFGERRYGDAIAEYGTVAKEFPRSSEAPDALLRTADSMIAMNLKDDALSVLSEIPKRYPSSAAAARARERIAELGGAKPQK